MSGSANVVFLLGYVQNEYALAKNKVLKDRFGEKRAFYSSNKSDNDYLGYIEKGTKEQITEPYFEDYIAYSGNDEKSTGVFNEDGLMKRSDKSALRQSLRETKSVIWHGIISFEEAFGKRYMDNYEDAYRLMKIEFPRFLKSAGFNPDKVEWFAGLHENTRYRHIHYSFFEKEPSRYSERSSKQAVFSHGKISKRNIEQFKIRVEQRLSDITSEIKASRKELSDLSKNLLFSPQSKLRYRSEIQEQLNMLIEKLPPEGKLGYDSKNMSHLKPQINKIIDALFKINKPLYDAFTDFCRKTKGRDASTIAMLKASKIDKCEWHNYLTADKTLQDLYRRLGNQIINKVRNIKGKEKSTKNRLAKKRIRRRTLQSLLAYTLELNANFEMSATLAFEEFLRKLDEDREKTATEINDYEME